MLFGLKNKSSAMPIAVFDISSSSVGGAHALIQYSGHEVAKDAPAHTLLASARVDAPLQVDLDMKRFVSDTVKNIETVAGQLRKADNHSPQRLQLVLASPWYVSQTRTIVHTKEAPFTCTHALVNSLVDAEIEHLIKTELEKFGGFGTEAMVVEKQISLVKLNGYVTADPFGKKARRVELFLTITVAPKQIVAQFSEALKRAYGSRPVQITTSTYATFVVARDYFSAAKDCVIIDAGEEVTDVAFVKDGLFLYQHSFPVGSYGLYRAVMDAEKHTAAEAEALVEGYRLGKVSATAKAKIDKALTQFSESWRQALQGILNEGHYGFCLPELCYITADPRFEGVYPAIVKNDPFIQHACSHGPVHASFIDQPALASYIRVIDDGFDVPLATAVLFVARVA
jgi:hypothetical protein